MSIVDLEAMDIGQIANSITNFELKGGFLVVEFEDILVPLDGAKLHGMIDESSIAKYVWNCLNS